MNGGRERAESGAEKRVDPLAVLLGTVLDFQFGRTVQQCVCPASGHLFGGQAVTVTARDAIMRRDFGANCRGHGCRDRDRLQGWHGINLAAVRADESTRRQDGKLPDQGDDRNERVPDHVAQDDDALAQALRPSGADLVLAQHLQHHRAVIRMVDADIAVPRIRPGMTYGAAGWQQPWGRSG